MKEKKYRVIGHCGYDCGNPEKEIRYGAIIESFQIDDICPCIDLYPDSCKMCFGDFHKAVKCLIQHDCIEEVK